MPDLAILQAVRRELQNLLDGEQKLQNDDRKAAYILKHFAAQLKRDLYHEVAVLTSIVAKALSISKIKKFKDAQQQLLGIVQYTQNSL
jgi:hypothetical protein